MNVLSYPVIFSSESFFFFLMFCLPGWRCHEKIMSVTNNKTDMFAEDWRAGCIFGINLDFAGSRSVKTWCKAQIASYQESEKYWLSENVVKKYKVNEAKSVPDIYCIGLNYVSLLTGHNTWQALNSRRPFWWVLNTHWAHTDIYSSAHLTSQPRYCMALNSQCACKLLQSACSWTIFFPLFSLLPCHLSS